MLRPRRPLKELRQPGDRGAADLGGGQADRGLVPEPALGLDPRDEARVGQKGSLEYIWAPIGSRPRAVRDNRHDSVYLFGALCAYRAVGAAVIMPAANTDAMNEHLKEISTQVAPGAHAVLVCHVAGWHLRGGKLKLPDNINLLSLPPYSPELNPMENVWTTCAATNSATSSGTVMRQWSPPAPKPGGSWSKTPTESDQSPIVTGRRSMHKRAGISGNLLVPSSRRIFGLESRKAG